MSITVIKGGVLSTLQDAGRYRYRAIGMPVSGVMDPLAAAIANILVGNTRSDAVLEITYGGFEIRAERDMVVALSGGGSEAVVDRKPLPHWKPLYLPAGTVVKFVTAKTGCRTYISIAGGWKGDEVLASRSTYLPINIGGHGGRALKAGDVLESKAVLTTMNERLLASLKNSTVHYPKWGVYINEFVNYAAHSVRVLAGQEWDWFGEAAQHTFLSQPYTLDAASNRMGYQLKGAPLELKTPRQLLSTAVHTGTIQVPGSGSPILLMADAQTTGGYPRIAQVAAADLPICAQLKPGDAVRFEAVHLEDAERAYVAQQIKLEELERSLQSTWMND